jgi:hypothetical protein
MKLLILLLVVGCQLQQPEVTTECKDAVSSNGAEVVYCRTYVDSVMVHDTIKVGR